MKKCPYCAELIQDEAVICRYCGHDVRVPPGRPGEPSAAPPLKGSEAEIPAASDETIRPAEAAWPSPSPGRPGPADRPAPSPGTGDRVGEGALAFSHSGFRYILGYERESFAIWDRQSPGEPIVRFPRTDEGWAEAWNRFSAMEPRAMEVPRTGVPPPDLRAPAGVYRDARSLARWVRGLIALSAVVSVVAIAIWARRIALLQAFERDEATAEQTQAAGDAAITAEGVSLFLVLVAGILWLMWQHRSQANLRAFGMAGLRFSPGWAVGWWFVPFANVVMPYLTMRELWKASDPEAGAADWRAAPGAALLGWWWAGWLASQVLSGISGTVAPQADATVGQAITEAWVSVAADGVFVLTAVLAIVLVRRVQARQEEKHARVVDWTRSFAGT